MFVGIEGEADVISIGKIEQTFGSERLEQLEVTEVCQPQL